MISEVVALRVIRSLPLRERDLWREDLMNEARYAEMRWMAETATCSPWKFIHDRLIDYLRDSLRARCSGNGLFEGAATVSLDAMLGWTGTVNSQLVHGSDERGIRAR